MPTLLRTALLLGMTCSGLACAQTDPGIAPRGLTVRFLQTTTQDRVVKYEYNGPAAYVRMERSEPGAVPNEFPFVIDPAALRAALATVRLPSAKNEPLFEDSELNEIVAPLARALAQATPEQDVCFAVSGRHSGLPLLALRKVTTARVLRVDGRLNLVFGLLRHEWESEFKGTGVVIAFEPGHRAAPLRYEPAVSIDAATGTSKRADWIVLNDTLPQPVAAPAPQPPPAPAAPAAPARAATPAPAPAAPATAPAAPSSPATADPQLRPNHEAIAQRLRSLKKLRDDGLITEQEYEEKRREILKDL